MDRFRTRYGQCVIEDGELRIESSLRGTVEGYGQKGIAFGVGAGLVVLAAIFVDSGSLRTTGLAALGGIGVVALVTVLNYLRTLLFDTNVIPLHEIDYVRAKEGRPFLSAPRFIVRYSGSTVSGKSAWRRRYVVMPSRLLGDGDELMDEGIELLRKNGVRVAIGDETPEEKTMQWEDEVDFSMGNRMAQQRSKGGPGGDEE